MMGPTGSITMAVEDSKLTISATSYMGLTTVMMELEFILFYFIFIDKAGVV